MAAKYIFRPKSLTTIRIRKCKTITGNFKNNQITRLLKSALITEKPLQHTAC